MRKHGSLDLSPRLIRIAAPALLLLAAVTSSGCHTVSGNVNNLRGRAFYQQGNYVAARQAFEQAAIDDPQNADYSHNVAAAARKMGDTATAEQMYRHAINVNPMHQPSYHQLAAMYREHGREDDAVQTIAGWANTQPYNAQAHVEHAWIQREFGDIPGAEQSLQHALRVSPSHPTALSQLGQLYDSQGNSRMAASMYRRSLAQNWDQPQVHTRLTTLQKRQPGSGLLNPPTLAAQPKWGDPLATLPPATHVPSLVAQPTFATDPALIATPLPYDVSNATYPPSPTFDAASYHGSMLTIDSHLAEPGPRLTTQSPLRAPGLLPTLEPPVPSVPTRENTTPISSLPTVQPF